MATLDAMQQSRVLMNPSMVLDKRALRLLEMDMDVHERVSCLFLIIQDYKLGYKTFTSYGRKSSTMISDFICENEITDWEDKLIEALCLLQNHEILHNLGISPEEAQLVFATKYPRVPHKSNRYAKALYCLFDNLSNDDASSILGRVYPKELPPPNDRTWPDKKSLEMHMLWWIQEGFVDIHADKWDLKKVLNILKALELNNTDAYETLIKWDSENNNHPCHYDDRSYNNQPTVNNFKEDNVASKPNEASREYKIHTGLAIVFNQMKFAQCKEQYEYRHGSEKDCSRIRETFGKIFGFEVKVHDNFSAREIYNTLDTLRFDRKYDCVVVFVLSHGTRGNIIASDSLECSIDEIQEKICCEALSGKPKILVIQACQTQALRTDGPVKSRKVERLRDFLQLSSTIPGEQSIRDIQKGTWFIQTLCDVLNEHSSLGWSFQECAEEVNNRLSNMKAEINNCEMEQVSSCYSTLKRKVVLSRASSATSESRT